MTCMTAVARWWNDRKADELDALADRLRPWPELADAERMLRTCAARRRARYR